MQSFVLVDILLSQYLVIGYGRILHVFEHVNVNLLYDHLISVHMVYVKML